ncbi:PREDICTED: farnesol dehydrogenase-like [Nicrophorus vespilloides]|uniref:Farnesol dehydrogenase-like n=1 Tax=Nicrophorus vespilloides TaxID=110193 RepID=A0ABM1N1Y7_NICVS|nr:PREDICTED: farnesol dehydrogenase-like [Nicrophorus vespilloides]
MDRWYGKVAVVTGASSGIGAAIAAKLVEYGMQVVGLARRVERVEEAAKTLTNLPGKLYAFKVDITQDSDIIAAFEWTENNLGPIHVLINNAGCTRRTNLIEGDAQMWRDIIGTNLIGVCVATKEAVKSMRTNNIDGHIVHVNSVGGHRILYFGNMYSPSKHALTCVTEIMRKELLEIGKIKVSSISPGIVDTEMLEKTYTKEQIELLPRLDPQDIVDGIVYILGTRPNVQVHELIIKPIGEQV